MELYSLALGRIHVVFSFEMVHSERINSPPIILSWLGLDIILSLLLVDGTCFLGFPLRKMQFLVFSPIFSHLIPPLTQTSKKQQLLYFLFYFKMLKS